MSGTGRRPILTAALTVAAGAGVATAHGLYQVAAAARVTPAIAWLYPLITDGLALVAYAATARLTDRGRRYAASIVILAAGLSGLAQALYLAGGLDTQAVAPAGLRFGVGAWPAIAAALTAHLLHLISTDRQPAATPDQSHDGQLRSPSTTLNSDALHNPAVQPRTPAQRSPQPVQPEPATPMYGPPADVNAAEPPSNDASPRERARAAGRDYHDRHGQLPTVTQLVDLARVARGTAAKALHDLKAERPALHLVNTTIERPTDP
jgi:hypothetical protein